MEYNEGMDNRKFLIRMNRLPIFSLCLLFLPLSTYASFIEATMGAAVVNDATATYFNPAALVLLKKPQAIALNTLAATHHHFTGQFRQARTDFTLSGSTSSITKYELPSFYIGIPNKKIA